MHRLVRFGCLAALALASCFRAAPDVAPSATIAPSPVSITGAEADGHFAVAFAGPRGIVVDRDEPAITVLFNRAMRTLETADDVGLPALRVETSGEGGKDGEARAVAGNLRWLGTHGLLFVPDAPLAGATAFAVTVPAGVRSIDGDSLVQPYRFELSTAPPRLLQVTPDNGASDVRPNDSFVLVFNQDVDPAAVEKSATLTVEGNPVALHAARARTAPRDVSAAHVVVVTPSAPLARDSAVELKIGAGLRGSEGPLPMLRARTIAVRTYGPLRLADVRCPKVNLARCQARRDVTVVLSNAVSPSELRAHLKTQIPFAPPPPPPHPAVAKRRAEPSREQPLGVDPRPGKRYRVTLTSGMRDVFGQALAQDVSFDVDIEAAFAGPAPGAPVAARGAPISAPPPPPEDDPSPRRPVLDYQAELGVHGNLLEEGGRGVAPARRLPIGIVNLPTYGLAAAALQEQEALRWLAKADPSAGPTGGGWRWDWITPSSPENVRSVRWMDIDALRASAKGSRAVLVALGIPGSSPSPARTAFLDVTDLGVTAKVSRYGSLVWVTRLSTGEPVSGAKVALRSLKRDVFAGATDAGGVAVIPAAAFRPISDDGTIDASTWLFVRKDDDWVYQRVERSLADSHAARDVDLAQKGEWQGIAFTDRGVYRPGETVKMSAILRRCDATGTKVPEPTDVRVEVKDEQGDRVFSGHAKTDAFGELSLDVPLPHTAHLGTAVVTARVSRDDDDAFEATVLLAAFKASEFRVGVDASKPEYVRGEDAAFSVKADYLYGAPMAGASAHNAASRSRTAFTPAGSAGFVTTDEVFSSDYPDESPRSASLKVDDGELDSQGRLKRTLALDLPGQTGPELVVFESEVEDLTRQTVAQRASVIVHPAPFYVGIGAIVPRFLAVGAPLKASVVAFEPGGAHRAGVPVRVELISRAWTEAAVDQASDVPRRGTKVVDTVIGSCDAVTTEAAAACTIRLPAAGYFILRATSAGPVVHASTGVYGIADLADGSPPVAWSDNGARGLTIDSDKETYQAGDTAKILVRSPFKEADALVTVERAGVLWRSVVHVRGPMPVVSIPIESSYYPNVFVGVHLVRGRVAPAPALGAADLGAPDFRTAYKELAIDQAAHRLKVAITTAKTEYRPGDEVSADVAVTDLEGHGARSAVTFYAVDEGVLMLTGYTTPDPLPAFAARKRLADFGIENRERLAHFIALKDGERVPIMGYEYERRAAEPNEASDKGGDGGDGGDGSPLRADFRTTAYFEPARPTSNEGRAHFQFKLPDNLTRFRLMAVVASPDDRFGFAESAVTASRKLMVRPAMPRIVRVGDTFQASVVVSSKDMGPANVAVTLDAKGVVALGPRSRTVTLPRSGQVEVRFPVRAPEPGNAEFVFAAAGGGFGDKVLFRAPVDLPVDVRTAAVYGEASGDFAIAIGAIGHVRPDRGSLDIRFATSALVGIDSAFDRLSDYPYGCTEQLTSRTLPLLALGDMARAFHVRVPAQSHDAIDDGVGAILRHQHGSGGFGYWDDDPEVPWLSAYALWALEEASKKGFYVPAGALDRGIAYLRAQLNPDEKGKDSSEDEPAAEGAPNEDPDSDPDTVSPRPPAPGPNPVHPDAARVFIADVLAVVGAPDPGYLDRAYEDRAAAPLSAQALLLHAMATAHLQKPELQTLAREIVQRLRVGPNEAVANEEDDARVLDSAGRTTALVLRGLLAADPQDPMAPKLVRGLLGMRHDGAWRSTQENLWALVALEDYRRAQESRPADVDVRAFLGSDPVGAFAFHGGQGSDEPVHVPMARVLGNGSGTLSFALRGEGKVFYSATLDYASVDLPVRPVDHGFFVQRLMSVVTPADLAQPIPLPKTSVNRARAGDLVLVDLLVESAEPRDQIVIDDPLAAGLEAIHFDVETSAKLQRVADVGTEKLSRHRGLGGYGWSFAVPTDVHREFRDDRVLTFARHLDPGMYHFRYLARATTLGRFVAPPVEIRCMYAPEANGRSAAGTFEVSDGADRVAAN